MKRIYLFTLVLVAAFGANVQQLTASSFYEMYSVLHNPATAGSMKYASIGGTFRSQWSGIPGGPQTGLIFGNTYLKKAKVGIGGYLYNDVTGPTSRNGLQMSYAYHIPMKNDASFSLGLEARVQQWSFDRSKLIGSLGRILRTSSISKFLKLLQNY